MLQTEPAFPPIYAAQACPMGDAFARGVEAARRGADAATLFWADRPDRLDCAIVLAPDRPLGQALQAVYVAAVALREAVGALGPAEKPITFAWPDGVLLDGALVGGVRVAASGEEVPDWMVIGAAVQVEGASLDPGLDPGRTALHDEGFGDVTVPGLAESFSRRFLFWTDRWIEDGTARVHREWLAHGPGLGSEIDVAIGDAAWAGRFEGLEPDGALRLSAAGRVALAECLKGPSWRL